MEPHEKRIGLIAAWGRYPVVVAEALVAQGFEVYCIAVKDHADEAALRPLCKEFLWNGVARLQRMHSFPAATRRSPRHDGRKIHKTTLYRPWVWLHHVPTCARSRCSIAISASRRGIVATIRCWERSSPNSRAKGSNLRRRPISRPELLVKLGPWDVEPLRLWKAKTSSSAGGSPRRWAGSTSGKASP